MMARLITMPLAPPSAWKKRAAISWGRVAAKMQPKLATIDNASPASITGRRPNRSDSGPSSNCEIAMPIM